MKSKVETEAEERIKKAIIEAEAAAKRAREWIERSRRAGVDVSEHGATLSELEAQNARMREVFIEGK